MITHYMEEDDFTELERVRDLAGFATNLLVPSKERDEPFVLNGELHVFFETLASRLGALAETVEARRARIEATGHLEILGLMPWHLTEMIHAMSAPPEMRAALSERATQALERAAEIDSSMGSVLSRWREALRQGTESAPVATKRRRAK